MDTVECPILQPNAKLVAYCDTANKVSASVVYRDL